MNTIEDKLIGLENTKESIKQSIINKGVPVDNNDPFSSYPNKIDNIFTNTGIPKITCYDTTQSVSSWEGQRWLKQIKSIDWTGYNINRAGFSKELFMYWPLDSVFEETLDFSTSTDFTSTFHSSNIRRIDLSKQVIKNPIESFAWMFSNCPYLEEIIMPTTKRFNNVYKASLPMIDRCPKLIKLDMSKISTKGLLILGKWTGKDSSYSSDKLSTIIWPENFGESLVSFSAGFSRSETWHLPGLSKESILDLFNKMVTLKDPFTLNFTEIEASTTLTPQELAIATNKGWEIITP